MWLTFSISNLVFYSCGSTSLTASTKQKWFPFPWTVINTELKEVLNWDNTNSFLLVLVAQLQILSQEMFLIKNVFCLLSKSGKNNLNPQLSNFCTVCLLYISRTIYSLVRDKHTISRCPQNPLNEVTPKRRAATGVLRHTDGALAKLSLISVTSVPCLHG